MEVILVDELDRQVGVMEKLEVHQKALLHRAFSIFIFNDKGEMLLQRRAAEKYHSAGLWTNACCSHPPPGIPTEAAAVKRLREEMGFSADLEKAFDFIYKAPFDNGLTEYEFDHVFIGKYNGAVDPDPSEVSDYCYRPIAELQQALLDQPGAYTVWFRIAFQKVVDFLSVDTSTPLDHRS